MNLVRKLKINKITPIEFTSFEIEILNFVDDNLKDLIFYETSLYVDYIFYLKKEGVCMLAQKKLYYRELDKKRNYGNDCVMVRADIHSVLCSYYCMKDKDAKNLIQWKVAKLLDEEISTINHKWSTTHIGDIENFFKREKSLFN